MLMVGVTAIASLKVAVMVTTLEPETILSESVSVRVTVGGVCFNAAKALSVENIFVTPELIEELTEELFDPYDELPQVTTLPSLFNAAKAPAFENIFVTPELIEELTVELSPPFDETPQVTTLPSLFNAAKT